MPTFAQTLYAVKVDDVPLTLVFKQLETDYGLKFSYNTKRLEDYKVVASIQTNNTNLLLQDLLKYTPFKSSLVDGVFLIIPDRNKAMNLPTVSGRIIDAQTGAPLAFAHIQGNAEGSIADLDGKFQLNSNREFQEIMVSFVGYTSKEVTINPDEEQLIIALRPDTSLLPEFIISANSSLKSNADISSFHINPKKITNFPSIGQPDIFKSLQLIPGISATDESNTGLSIRGSGSEQNLVLMDGFTVYHLDHLFGLYSSFNPYTVQQVNVYKGAFHARYGGRISSVVDARMKAPNLEETKIGIGLSPTSLNAYIESPLSEKLSLISSVRSSYSSLFRSYIYDDFIQQNRTNILEAVDPFYNEDPITLTPEFSFSDFNIKVRYRPTGKDYVDLNVFVSGDSYEGYFIEEEPDGEYLFEILDNAEWGNLGTSLNWTRFNSNEVTNQYSASLSSYSSTSSSIIRETLPGFFDEETDEFTRGELGDTTLVFNDLDKQNQLSDITLKWQQKRTLPSNNKLEFGVEGNLINTFYNISYFEEDESEFDVDGVLIAGFAQYEFIEGNLDLSAGLRSTYYLNTDRFYFEPRLNARYRLFSNLHLKAAYGIHNQFINRLAITPFGNNDQFYWIMADDFYYPVMYSRHWIGGAVYEKDSWSVDFEVYDKSTFGTLESEFVLYTPFAEREFDQFEDFINYGETFTRGLDLFIKKRSDNFTTWIGYTLSETFNAFESINEGLPYPSLLDQRHEINWVTQYQLGRWAIGSTFVYGSGRPFTPPNPDAISNFIVYDIDNINGLRLPTYHRLDLSASYRMQLGKWNVNIGATLFNVYNQANIKSRRYTLFYEFDEERKEENIQLIPIDQNLLGFAPSFFIDIRR